MDRNAGVFFYNCSAISEVLYYADRGYNHVHSASNLKSSNFSNDIMSSSLLSSPMELLDGAKLIKDLLVHQTRGKKKFVVGDEFIDYLFFHPFSLFNDKHHHSIPPYHLLFS